MQKLFCQPLKWWKSGAWGCYFMQLPGDQVQGVIKLLWCELCCGFGILFIFSHAIVFMVSKLGQQQTGQVGKGERARSALCQLLAPCLLPFSQWEWGECHAAYQSMTWDLKAWNMALEQGCLLSDQQRKLKYRQMKSSLGIMASSS